MSLILSAVPSVVSEAPAILATWLAVFRPCFTAPVWSRVLVLVAGAVLSPGKRTITQALRVMGLADQPGFRRYHEALSRARWDSREVAHRLLMHLLAVLWPSGEVVIAIDDTIERRWGAKIKARGIYRDPVRSSRGMFVKTSGLRWLSLAVMSPIPFAGKRWALPFLTVLAPSARWSEAQGKRHKTLTDRARQAILQAKRWLADRSVVVVADSSFAALELIAAVRDHVCLITRLRLDANLFEPAPERRSGQRGRPPLKGKPLPKLSAVLTDPKTVWTRVTMSEWYGGQTRELEYVSGVAVWYKSGLPPAKIRWILVRDPTGEREPQAFLCTDANREPEAVLCLFVFRWRIETTFQEVREHLGVETQRVVRLGDTANDTGATRFILINNTLGTWIGDRAQRRRPTSCRGLVRKVPAHLQRRDCRRSPRPLDARGFFDLPAPSRNHRNPRATASTTRRDSIPSGVKCGKSS